MTKKIEKLEVPSGRVFTFDDFKLLPMMKEYGLIRMSEKAFVLKSGIESNFYIYGREDVTDHPDFEWELGLKIAKDVRDNSTPADKQPCLIGLPTAGTPLAQAASMVSYKEKITVNGSFICHRVMREKLKTYGAHPNWVNGDPDVNKHTYWTVDNVVTNGASKLETNDKLRENGIPVDISPNYIFIDRQQGGIKKMEEAGLTRIIVGYYLLDLTFAFGEMDL